MLQIIQLSMLTFLTVCIGFSLGCSTTQQQNDIVATTLNSYRAGKTTFADLKEDTGMVLVGVQAPSDFPHKSYLNPSPNFMKRPDPVTYILPAGSPWKIYETRQKLVRSNGQSRRTWDFMMGNTNKAICRLEFDFDNTLTNISPIHDVVSPQASKFYIEFYGSVSNFPSPKAEFDSYESPNPLNIEVVQTLQSYQTDKTTIQDFVRDAKLINLYYPELNATTTNSNATSMNLERMVRSNYRVPSGSPWKIYETGKGSSIMFGVLTRRWKFVVGDVNKPNCILCFDERGILREKTPLP